MAFPAVNGAASTRYHFPQLDEFGRCAKMIKPHKTGSQEPCGQGRDGTRHLYYQCRISRRCRVKTWSIEARITHESEHSR